MLRCFFFAACAVVAMLLFAPVLGPAFAAEATPVVGSTFLVDLWTILRPLVEVFVSIAGPAFVTWLTIRLTALIKTTDANKRLEIEGQLRDALHQSAFNALKYAASRAGVPFTGTFAPGVLKQAIQYVKDKNPQTLTDLGVSDDALSDIIHSKVPDLTALLNAAGKTVR